MGAGASTSSSGEVRPYTHTRAKAVPSCSVRGRRVLTVVLLSADRDRRRRHDPHRQLPKRVIGLVADVQNDICSVQVSNTEIIREIPRTEVQRIACWSEIEDGDIVKVREEGSRLYHEATVECKHGDDGTYRVRFRGDDDGDDEVEDRVESARILKLMSGRLEQKEWMMYKETPDDAH